jgi:hypothetical protein
MDAGAGTFSMVANTLMRFGVSLIALSAASAAGAKCAPNLSVETHPITCTGADTDGLTITTNEIAVTVMEGASIAPRPDGLGSIVLKAKDNFLQAYLYNAGSIRSDKGAAITAVNRPGREGFAVLSNQRGGEIIGSNGAIAVIVNSLYNDGLIDGGAGSAYGFGSSGGTYFFPAFIRNSGTMRNNSDIGTIDLAFGSPYLLNTGRIINAGNGPVYDSGTESLSVANEAGAIISTQGAVALRSAFQLNLYNKGTITGSVIGGSGFSDYIDTRSGMIDGDVRLNDGDDILIAAFGAGGRVSNISGQIDGGAGNDILSLTVSGDQVVNRAIKASGFERLQFHLTDNASLSLAQAKAPSGGYEVGGNGTLVMASDMDKLGPIVTGSSIQSNYGESGLTFQNAHALRATLDETYKTAVSLSLVAGTNTGLIKAIGGGGASFGMNQEGVFTNSGTIEADGVALTISGSLVNDGAIRSLNDIGLANDLGGGGVRTRTSINNGVIEGRGQGASISSIVFVNTGTITASEGAAIGMDGALLDNRAGGIIRGQGTAIKGYYDERILNAGLIDGDVDLSRSTWDPGLFVDRGGTVTGNLRLGAADDYYFTTLARGTSGVSGVIDPGDGKDSLVFLVGADTQTAVPNLGSFEKLGFELNGGAALALTGAVSSVSFSGDGSVDLSADMVSTRPDLIIVGAPTLDRLLDPTASTTGNLSVVSHGAIRFTPAPGEYLFDPIVRLTGSSSYQYFPDDRSVSFENAGSISSSGVTAIGGIGNVHNSGLIEVGQATAISVAYGLSYWDEYQAMNSGTIRQLAGGNLSAGIYGFRHVINSGTIDTDRFAVWLGEYNATLVNSGLLRSTSEAAVIASGYAQIDNQESGHIEAGEGGVAVDFSRGSGILRNAGTIVGTVDFRSDYYSYSPSAYVGGGTITGDVLFGSANDIFVQVGTDTGVSGRIDGGDGQNIFAHLYQTDSAVQLGAHAAQGFNYEYIGAADGVTATIDAASDATKSVFVGGDGTLVNLATLDGFVTTDYTRYTLGVSLLELSNRIDTFVNEGTLVRGASIFGNKVVNSGLIGGEASSSAYLNQFAMSGDLLFSNSGTISQGYGSYAVRLEGRNLGRLHAENSGTINGWMLVTALLDPTMSGEAVIENSGTIRNSWGTALSLGNIYYPDAGSGHYHVNNSGVIESGGVALRTIDLSFSFGRADVTVDLVNSGSIRVTGSGTTTDYFDWDFPTIPVSEPAAAISFWGTGTTPFTLTNEADGLIESTGTLSTTILVQDAALTLDNAGTIMGGPGTKLTSNDFLSLQLGNPYLAGAVQTVGDAADSITNSGTIMGSIDLAGGNDSIVNRGTIIGDVYLRDGDDSFLQLASAVMQGIVDGGAGTDSFIVDATSGGTINADSFVNFERFTQIGNGDVTYTGTFSFNTIGLDGGTIVVNAGETLGTVGAITITGGAGDDMVRNAGTIAGGIDLAGGNDSIFNAGVIGGAVWLGAGDDNFTEESGSKVAGLIDGGAGIDLYRVILAGDRSGLGAQSGFERLAVEGDGTLALALAQGYDDIQLVGTGLDLTTSGHFVGQLNGSDAAETARVTGDVARISLGAGNDTLGLSLMRAAGRYDGGAGTDSLSFIAGGPVTLAGIVTGFETINLAGGTMVVTGRLGATDDTIHFGDNSETVDIATGGGLLGHIDMGAGDDSVRFADGAIWQGVLSGGAGRDSLILAVKADQMLSGDRIADFEILSTSGGGSLTLAGAFMIEKMDSGGDLTIGADASLVTDRLAFGQDDDDFRIAGRFAGAVDGGGGINRIAIDTSSADPAVRFASVSNIASLDVAKGTATVAGDASFGAVDLHGGRLAGLAGSTIRASSIVVRNGASFGSVGTVAADILVGGTLRLGATPGVMTIAGDFGLASGSATQLLIGQAASDQIHISGALTIADGATLSLETIEQIRPGTTIELIAAAGGITGRYTTIVKPDDLFGFIVQDDERIRLLGQFMNDARFTPQVQRAIDYTNSVIGTDGASDALVDALPILATSTGASNPAAFARLTAEPYAAATQLGIDNGLAIVDATRSIAQFSSSDTPRVFGIGQYLGGLGRIAADERTGISATRSNSRGLLGGLGMASDRWSVAAYGGYLDSRQTLPALGSRNDGDGWFAGLAASATLGQFRIDTTLAYHRMDMKSERGTPSGDPAHGRFRLNSWIGALSFSYEAPLGDSWVAAPDVGLTYIATKRTAVTEDRASPWALDVAKDDHDALFALGGLRFSQSRASDTAVRPFVRLGAQYQIHGRGVDALSGFAGMDQTLVTLGARRARLVGSVSGGVEVRASTNLSLFANASQTYSQDDRRASASVGIKLAF